MAMGFSKFKCRPFWSALLLGLIWLLFALFFSSPVEAAATANAMTLSASEDVYKWIKFNVLAGYGELDGATFTIVTPPTRGTVTIVPADTTLKTGYHAKYVSKPNLFGTDKFAYQVKTKSGVLSNIATVTLNVAAVNDAPPAPALTQSTVVNKQTPYLNLPSKDVDGDTLRFEFLVTTGQGSMKAYDPGMAGYGGKYYYVPPKDFLGTDAIKYGVSDGTVTKYSTITVTVNPAVLTAAYAANEDGSPILNLPQADGTNKCNLLTLPQHALLTYPGSTTALHEKESCPFVNGYFKVQFRTEKDYNGTDFFKYEVLNSGGQTIKTVTLNVTVKPVNDKPTAKDVAAATKMNAPLVIDLAPYASDVDAGDKMQFELDAGTAVKNGAVEITPDGKAAFSPASNFSGEAQFGYKVTDAGGLSASAIARVTVNAVASVSSFTVDEDLTLTVKFSDSDDNRKYQVVSRPANGKLLEGGGGDVEVVEGGYFLGVPLFNIYKIRYRPHQDYNGKDSFVYQVLDAGGSIVKKETVSITVNSKNDAPVARYIDGISTEMSDSVQIDLTGHASDPDGDPLSYSLYELFAPSGGDVEVFPSGLAFFVPGDDFAGNASFKYAVTDPDGRSSSAQVKITVIGNQVPTAKPMARTLNEGEILKFNLLGTDPEGAPLTFKITQAPKHGSAKMLSANQAQYAPASGYSGPDFFNFTASDGARESLPAFVSLTVTKINDAPVVLDMTESMNENETLKTKLKGGDPDLGETLVYTVSASDNADVSVFGDELSLTPDKDYDGTIKLSYSASDGLLVSNTATITVTVNGGNQAPTARSLKTTIPEDQETFITLPATDPEGKSLTFAITQAPERGEYELVGNRVKYVPEPDYYGADQFRFTAKDESLTSAVAIVDIAIEALPDPVVSCAGEDPAHLQDHAEPGVSYWDNLIGVIADRPLTSDERGQLLDAVDDGADFLCSIDQNQLTEDEAGGLVDPTRTGFGLYTIRLPSEFTYEALNSLAATLESFGFVRAASPLVEGLDAPDAAETDAEAYAESSKYFKASMPIEFYNHQLEGALEYLRAYQKQGGTLHPLNLAVVDTGICSDTTSEVYCNVVIPGLKESLGGIVKASPNILYGVPLDSQMIISLADRRLKTSFDSSGNAVKDSEGQAVIIPDLSAHGSYVAGIWGTKSDDSLNEPDYSTGGGYRFPSNGVLGGVKDLQYAITSYNINGMRDSDFAVQEPNISGRILSHMAGKGYVVVNHSHAPILSNYEQFRKWHDFEAILYSGAIASQSRTLHLFAAANDNINLDDGTPYSNNFLLSRSNSYNSFLVQSGKRVYNSESRWVAGEALGSNYGQDVKIMANNHSTSYSTPVVAGAASLIKAIKPEASPKSLMDTLINVGNPSSDTDDNANVLDIAASVLLAIKDQKPEFVPFSANSLHFTKKAKLSEMKPGTGAEGDYEESVSWTIPEYGKKRALDITASQAITQGVSGDGKSTFQTHSLFRKTYKLGLEIKDDYKENSRKIPALSIFPTSHPALSPAAGDKRYKHAIRGKYEQPYGEIVTPGAYCLELFYDVNPSAENAANGFIVPLAKNSGTQNIVPFHLSNVELKGNAIKYAPLDSYALGLTEIPEPLTLCPTLTGQDVDVTTDGMAPPDNKEEFLSWANSVRARKFDVQRTQKINCCEFDGKDGCTTGSNARFRRIMSDTPVCEDKCPEKGGWYDASEECGISAKGVPISPPHNVHFEVKFDDVQCQYNMMFYIFTGGRKSNDLKIPKTENLVQTFEWTGAVFPEQCRTKARITISTLYKIGYQAGADEYPVPCVETVNCLGFMCADGLQSKNFYDDTCNSEFGERAHVKRVEITAVEDIEWDMSSGVFPVKGVIAAIEKHLPKSDSYQSHTGDQSYHVFNTPLIPEFVLPPRLASPNFGSDMEDWLWAPGIGPLKAAPSYYDSNQTEFQFEADDVFKLDRTVK